MGTTYHPWNISISLAVNIITSIKWYYYAHTLTVNAKLDAFTDATKCKYMAEQYANFLTIQYRLSS